MKNRLVGSIILVLVTVVLWFVWASLRFTQHNINLWKELARANLIALHTRVSITPDRHIVKYFQVNYDAPHFVGLTFKDQSLSDSLEKYIGWFNPPDYGLRISWTLYNNQDSLMHRSLKHSTGSNGNTLIFDEFEGQSNGQYKLDFHFSKLPNFVKSDSAWLVVGVSSAAVSVGNEYLYGLVEAIANYLSDPAFWMAIIVSIFTLFYFLQRRLKNHKSN